MNLTSKYDDLVAELKQIFQMDKSDLDFGIYRIMNSQAKVIEEYLTKDLRKDVDAAFASADDAKRKELEAKRAKAAEGARAAGIDPATAPAVQKLDADISALGKGTAAGLETQVYTHLLTFFSRYYEEGDFISKRRYNGDKYVIPYAGEEVKLVWANADQYYIKSSETLANYVFKLPNGKTVAFRLVSADQEKDNIKEAKERRFILAKERTEKRTDEEGEEYDVKIKPFTIEGDTLTLWFDYQPLNRKQSELILEACDRMMKNSAQWLKGFPDLAAPCPTKSDKSRTRFQKELEAFVAKNTTDYFIHKDLGSFLNRELDNYLKNEVLDLDDTMDAASDEPYAQKLAVMRTIRTIGRDLIAFMAQLENFQKKLWLKKKFVVQSDFCITLDRVEAAAPELLDEIWSNEKQLQRWVDMGFFKTKASANKARKDPSSKYLMADTAYFPPAFKAALQAAIPDFDAQCDGLLIHSENFGALNLLQERYKGEIGEVFTDPPYNTEDSEGENDINYKDCYKHSSWISFYRDRLSLSFLLMSERGIHSSTISDSELIGLLVAYNNVFNENNRMAIVEWNSTKSVTNKALISMSHTHIPIYAKSKDYFIKNRIEFRLPDSEDGFSNPDNDPRGKWKADPFQVGGERPNQRYDVINPKTGEVYRPNSGNSWKNEYTVFKQLLEDNRIVFGVSGEAGPQRKRFWYEAEERGRVSKTWWEDLETTTNGTRQLKNLFGVCPFKNPKPCNLLERMVNLCSSASSVILDYFAGSGTTAHAVINLNRDDQENGHRKYILVEMGHHFDTVLKPRIEKIVYSKDWKDGEPVESGDGVKDALPGMGGNTFAGVSHCFKYMTLESYEDALNNTFLKDVKTGELNLLSGNVQKDFLLRYMLDVKARGSVLSTKDFDHPFDYALNIAVDSAGATESRRIDLVETFNYLIGLRVAHTLDRRAQDGVVIVDGTLPDGGRALTIWRDVAKVPNASLEKLIKRLGINLRSTTYKAVYVNGDTTLQTQHVPFGGTVANSIVPLHLLEEEFLSRMFTEE